MSYLDDLRSAARELSAAPPPQLSPDDPEQAFYQEAASEYFNPSDYDEEQRRGLNRRAYLPPDEPPVRRPSKVRRLVADPLISLEKGLLSLPEAAVGLADLQYGGLPGLALEKLGVDFEGSREYFEDLYSPEQKAANEQVAEADGFVDTVKKVIKNPSTVPHMVIESAPLMAGGAGIARGALKAVPKLAPYVAGAVGEGAVSGGLAAERIRQQSEDGLLSGKQTALAVGSGIGTGLFGALGGKLANSKIGRQLGITDIDTLLASGKLSEASKKSVLLQLASSALMEGTIEELPQSAQEQIAQNLALERPWDEGVAEAAVLGWFAGTAMGAGGGGYSAFQNRGVRREARELEAANDELSQYFDESGNFTPRNLPVRKTGADFITDEIMRDQGWRIRSRLSSPRTPVVINQETGTEVFERPIDVGVEEAREPVGMPSQSEHDKIVNQFASKILMADELGLTEERKKLEDEMIDRLGSDTAASYDATRQAIASGKYIWVEGVGLQKKQPEPPVSETTLNTPDKANTSSLNEVPTPAEDFARYNEIQTQIMAKIKAGDIDGQDFQDLWTENEQIKNRNKGMPPTNPGGTDIRASIQDMVLGAGGKIETVEINEDSAAEMDALDNPALGTKRTGKDRNDFADDVHAELMDRLTKLMPEKDAKILADKLVAGIRDGDRAIDSDKRLRKILKQNGIHFPVMEDGHIVNKTPQAELAYSIYSEVGQATNFAASGFTKHPQRFSKEVTPNEEKRQQEEGVLTPLISSQGNDPNQKLKDLIGNAFQKQADEQRGQAILDTLDEEGKSPQQVVRQFWSETYDNLPAKVQKRFQNYIRKMTSFSVGDELGTKPDGSPLVANHWSEIWDDVPNEIRYLEGEERGLIALMETANRNFSEAIKQLSDTPAVSKTQATVPPVVASEPRPAAPSKNEPNPSVYTPAVRASSGRVITGRTHGDALKELGPSTQPPQRGYVKNSTGEFLNLLEVVRDQESGKASDETFNDAYMGYSSIAKERAAFRQLKSTKKEWRQALEDYKDAWFPREQFESVEDLESAVNNSLEDRENSIFWGLAEKLGIRGQDAAQIAFQELEKWEANKSEVKPKAPPVSIVDEIDLKAIRNDADPKTAIEYIEPRLKVLANKIKNTKAKLKKADDAAKAVLLDEISEMEDVANDMVEQREYHQNKLKVEAKFEIKPQPPIVEMVDWGKGVTARVSAQGTATEGKGEKKSDVDKEIAKFSPKQASKEIEKAPYFFEIENFDRKVAGHLVDDADVSGGNATDTHRITFFENTKTGQVIGLPTYRTTSRGRNLTYVAPLPGAETGTTLVGFLANKTYKPIASIRIGNGVNAKDPNAKWIYEDVEQFNEQVKEPALIEMRTVAANAEEIVKTAVKTVTNAETGVVTEVADRGSISASQLPSFPADSMENFVKEKLTQMRLINLIEPQHVRLATEQAVEENEDVFWDAMTEIGTELVKNDKEFLRLDAIDKRNAVLEKLAHRFYEQFQIEARSRVQAKPQTASAGGQGAVTTAVSAESRAKAKIAESESADAVKPATKQRPIVDSSGKRISEYAAAWMDAFEVDHNGMADIGLVLSEVSKELLDMSSKTAKSGDREISGVQYGIALIAQELAKTPPNATIKFIAGKKGLLGDYTPGEIRIFLDAHTKLNDSVPVTILHEAVHGRLVYIADAYETGHHDLLTGRQIALMEEIEKNFKAAKKARPDWRGRNALSNLDEFIAELMSEPEFQRAMKTVASPTRPRLSVWKAFVKLVSNFIGGERVDNNIFEAAMDLVLDLNSTVDFAQQLTSDRFLLSKGVLYRPTSPAELARQQAGESVAQLPVVAQIFEQLDEAASSLDEDKTNLFEVRVAQKTLTDPTFEGIRNSLDNLRQLVSEQSDVATDYFVYKSDARYGTDEDYTAQVGNAAAKVVDSITHLRSKAARMDKEFDGTIKSLEDELSQSKLDKEIKRDLAAVSRVVIEEYKGLLRYGLSSMKSTGGVEAYKKAFRQHIAGGKLFEFLIREGIDPDSIAMPKESGFTLAKALVERTGAKSEAELQAKVGATIANINIAGEFLKETKLLRNAIQAAQKVLDGKPTKAEEEFYERLQEYIDDGEVSKAVSLFTSKVVEAGKERAGYLHEGNFFAAKERRLLVKIAALKNVREIAKKIVSDPDFRKLESDAYAEIGVEQRVLTSSTNRQLVLREIPGYSKEVVLSSDSTVDSAHLLVKAIQDYNVAARQYLDKPESLGYSEALAQGLRAWLKHSDSWMADASPEFSNLVMGGVELAAGKVWLAEFVQHIFQIPEAVAAQVFGAPGKYFTDTLGAFSTAISLESAMMKRRLPELQEKAVKARNSHAGINDFLEYRELVFNPLLESGQYYGNSGRLTVGSTFFGQTITQEDIDLINTVRAYQNELIDKTYGQAQVNMGLLSQYRSGIELMDGVLRNRVNTGPTTTSRSEWPVVDFFNRWNEAGANKAKLLNDHSRKMLLGYLKGASEKSLRFNYKYRDYLKQIYTEGLDGTVPLNFSGDMLTQLATRILEEYAIDFSMSDAPAPTLSEVRETILSEVDALLKRYDAKPEKPLDSRTGRVTMLGGKSAANTARGEQVYPGLWYDYGSLTNAEHFYAAHSALTQLEVQHLDAIDGLKAALRRKVDDFERGKNKGDGINDFYTAGSARYALENLVRYEKSLLASLVDRSAPAPHSNSNVRGLGKALQAFYLGSLLMRPSPTVNNLIGVQKHHFINRQLFLGEGVAKAGFITGVKGLANAARFLGEDLSIGLHRWITKNADFINKMLPPMARYMEDLQHKMDYAREVGIDSKAEFARMVKALMASAGTEGEINYDQRGRTGKALGGGVALAKAGAAAVGYAVQKVDQLGNRTAIELAADIGLDLGGRWRRFGESRIAKAKELGYDPFNVADKRNRFSDMEIAGNTFWKNISNLRLTGNLDASQRAAYIRELFQKKLGTSLDAVGIDYLKRVEDAKAKGEDTSQILFLSDELNNQLILALAEDTNMASFRNRPTSFKTGRVAKLAGMFFGYQAWDWHRYSRMAGSPIGMGGSRRRGSRWASSTLERLPLAFALNLGNLIGGVAFVTIASALLGLLRKESPLEELWDAIRSENPRQQVPRALLQAWSIQVPFYGWAVAMKMGWAFRNGYDVNNSFVLLNQVTDIAKTMTEVVQNRGQWQIPVTKWLSRSTPAYFITPFLPHTSGLNERSATLTLLSKAGRMQGIEVRKYRGGDVTYTPMSPMLDRFVNAVGNGDMEASQFAVQEMIDYEMAESGLDETKARQSVSRRIQARNPVNQTFGAKLSDDQFNAALGNLKPSERERVNRFLNNFSEAVAQVTGKPVTYTQSDVRGGSSSRLSPSFSRLSPRATSRLAPRSGSRSRLTSRVNYVPSRLGAPKRTSRRRPSRLSAGTRKRRTRTTRLRSTRRRRLSRRSRLYA